MTIFSIVIWTLLFTQRQESFVSAQNTGSSLLNGTVYRTISNLYDDVLNGYDSRIIPRLNKLPPLQNITISYQFRLLNIISFETATQKLSVLGFFNFTWTDEILNWNPLAYGGIGFAKFPINQVWAPSIALAKSFDGHDVVGDPADVVIYSYDGHATWIHVGKYNMVCHVTIQFYPFDKQRCVINVFVSDAFLTEVVLVPAVDAVGTQSFDENTEWKLVGFYTYISEYVIGTRYNVIVLELERRTAFILFTVISPLILLSVLNVCVFLIPVDSCEKASTSVTIFLSYGVFVSAIRDELPHNSINVSYLMIYIEALLLFSVLSVIYCFVQSWIYSNYGDTMFKWRLNIKLPKTLKNITIPQLLKTKVDPEPSDSYDNDAKHATVECLDDELDNAMISCKRFMKRVDTIVFIICLCVTLISTKILFVFLSQRRT